MICQALSFDRVVVLKRGSIVPPCLDFYPRVVYFATATCYGERGILCDNIRFLSRCSVDGISEGREGEINSYSNSGNLLVGIIPYRS